ncbi:MAG TPA: hypothetical protein VNT57_07210 [Desulfobacteria bacterium]|nr:hypothetical protein [Desulfobacteria bacterium]
MSYDMLTPGLYSPAKLRPNRKKRIWIPAFLLISALIQFITLFGLEVFFNQISGINIVPETTTEVLERRIVLQPPLSLPGLMSVSPDHLRLAAADTNEIKIYNLKDGALISEYPISGKSVGSMQWLPDRNRLIFALIDTKLTTKVIKSPQPKRKSNVFDEAYSTDSYREPDQSLITSQRFEIALYGWEGTMGASPELIQTLRQEGLPPQKVDLSVSTYTNLLFVQWNQAKKDNLVQVDIMNRIKDIPLPRGALTKVVVSPRSGSLWVEITEDNFPSIYLYQKGRWKLQTYLDGYNLLGATPDDSLAVATDQNGFAKEVDLVDEKGNFKPGWSFTDPIHLQMVKILKDGRLLLIDNGRVIVHSAKLGEGTLFNTEIADSYSPDGKMVVSWIESTNELQILEEVQGKKE